MNRHTIFLGAIGLMVLPLSVLMAQNESIVIKRNLNESTIEFKDSKGEVSKAWSVKDANPYKDGPTDRRAAETGRGGGHFSTQGLVSNVTKGAIAISYSNKVFSQDFEQLQDQGESTVLAYDRTGKEIFKQIIKADNASEPLMAPNAKYVGVYFGGLVHDGITIKNGFSIYDISSGSIVYDISTPSMSGAAVFDDVFVFTYDEPGGQYKTHYVFDTTSGILYKKTYSLDEARFRKRFDNKGIVFLLPPDGERTESYQKYFTIIKR